MKLRPALPASRPQTGQASRPGTPSTAAVGADADLLEHARAARPRGTRAASPPRPRPRCRPRPGRRRGRRASPASRRRRPPTSRGRGRSPARSRAAAAARGVPGGDDEAGAADPVGLELLDDHAVEDRAQQVLHRALAIVGCVPVPTLSVVIVAHESRAALARTLPALVARAARRRRADRRRQRVGGRHAWPRCAGLAPDATVVETGANLGFAAACNRGAAVATGELLCLLNPDAVPQPGWREAIELPATDGRGWSAWQALVTADGGRTINTRGGVLHFTGDRLGGRRGRARHDPSDERRATSDEPGFVSGACLTIPRQPLRRPRRHARALLPLPRGRRPLAARPARRRDDSGSSRGARVDHDYEFDKGAGEVAVPRAQPVGDADPHLPGALLALLVPALLATELALVVVAAAGGWLPQKLRAWAETARVAAAAARRAPPDPGGAPDRRRRVRRRAHCPPSTRPTSGARAARGR